MSKKIIIIIAILIAFGAGFGTSTLVSSHHAKTRVGHNNKKHHTSAKKNITSTGSVLSDSGSTITIKLKNGNTETIYTANTTSYSQITKITNSNISNGSTIKIIGTKNNGGSMTAKKVILE